MSLEHWESYYRSGALATCPTSPAGGLDGEVRDGWTAFFAGQPDGARILDIGTGNGVVALLAAETGTSLGRRWDIHASDLARIDPVRHLADGATRFAGITFHPEVAAESLPFSPGYFDAVSGQYVLEHTRRPAALAEIHRVLKPGGRARFVLHHADSVPVGNGRRSLRHADWVLRETKIFRLLRRHLETARKSPAAARKTWRELNDTAHLIRHGLLEPGSNQVITVTLDAIQKLLNASTRLSPGALELEITRIENELRLLVRRMRDLVDPALDETGIAALEDEAKECGFLVVERAPQKHGEALVGWSLSLARA